ncbi:diacylglycerol kinase family protein, partial [Arthrospira platensis SPKY1]|nr:diacylglycerol kinase family protein [Arthrospira platensis SPKY1]
MNLEAGLGRCARAWPTLQRQIAAHLPVSAWHLTQERGHAMALAEQAIAEGCRHLLAVGGDGTNHELANGIMQ